MGSPLQYDRRVLAPLVCSLVDLGSGYTAKGSYFSPVAHAACGMLYGSHDSGSSADAGPRTLPFTRAFAAVIRQPKASADANRAIRKGGFHRPAGGRCRSRIEQSDHG